MWRKTCQTDISDKKLEDKFNIPSFIVFFTIIVLFVVGISYYLGYTVVIPHLVDIPIILCAYYYPKKGPAFALALSAIYVLMTAFISGFSGIEILYSMGRAIIFIIIATAVSILSKTIIYEREKYSDLFKFLPDITCLKTSKKERTEHFNL